MRRGRGAEESGSNIFIKKLSKSFKLYRGSRINSSKGWGRSFLQINLEIVWTMRRKLTSLGSHHVDMSPALQREFCIVLVGAMENVVSILGKV